MTRSGDFAISCLAVRHGHVSVLLAQTDRNRDAGRTQTVNPEPFDPALGLPGGKEAAWWMGDYQALAVSAGAVHPLWADTRTGRLSLFTCSVPVW